MDNYTTFEDVYISDSGVRIKFAYARVIKNRWHVVAQITASQGAVEIYTAHDENPESIEELFVTHRTAVAQLLTSLAHMIAVKGLTQ